MSGKLGPGASVLVDANVIIESHRIRAWRALAGGYHMETVEDCVVETQTGFQLRRKEQLIALPELRASLAREHQVGDRERAELLIRMEDIALDRGEESLWAHALGRGDAWFMCGPDAASLRCGVRLGLQDRIVSLEALLEAVGHRTRTAPRRHYTRQWQERVLVECGFAEAERSARGKEGASDKGRGPLHVAIRLASG